MVILLVTLGTCEWEESGSGVPVVQRKAFSYIWNPTWGKNFHIKAERTSEKVQKQRQKQLLSSYLSLSAMVQNFVLWQWQASAEHGGLPSSLKQKKREGRQGQRRHVPV